MAIKNPRLFAGVISRLFHTAKSPIDIEDNYGFFVCPSCGNSIYASDDFESHKFCLNCGRCQPGPIPGGGFTRKGINEKRGKKNMANTKAMIEQLDALTADEVRGDLALFRCLYGEKPVKPLKLEEIKDFSFWDNGQTVLIYSGRRCVYDCNYSKFYGLKRLTSCYSKNGLVADFKNY